MPRYRFSWSNLPNPLLSVLAETLEVETHGDAANALREIYGARPQEEFIEDAWELLRDVWLAEDAESRAEIVATLRERGLGEVSLSDDMDYLRSCRNTANLRRIVLPTFITLGEFASDQATLRRRQDGDESPDSPDETDSQSQPPKGRHSKVGLPKDDSSVADLPKGKSQSIDDESPQTHESSKNPVENFRNWLLKQAQEFTKNDDLIPDEDGDIPLDVGSARTYLSARGKPLSVDIYSILLSKVDQSHELLEVINRRNCDASFAKIKYLSESREVVLHHEIMAEALNSNNLASHSAIIAQLADALDSELQRDFGGAMHGADIREDEQQV
jgi:hypothetical protein